MRRSISASTGLSSTIMISTDCGALDCRVGIADCGVASVLRILGSVFNSFLFSIPYSRFSNQFTQNSAIRNRLSFAHLNNYGFFVTTQVEVVCLKIATTPVPSPWKGEGAKRQHLSSYVFLLFNQVIDTLQQLRIFRVPPVAIFIRLVSEK